MRDRRQQRGNISSTSSLPKCLQHLELGQTGDFIQSSHVGLPSRDIPHCPPNVCISRNLKTENQDSNLVPSGNLTAEPKVQPPVHLWFENVISSVHVWSYLSYQSHNGMTGVSAYVFPWHKNTFLNTNYSIILDVLDSIQVIKLPSSHNINTELQLYNKCQLNPIKIADGFRSDS